MPTGGGCDRLEDFGSAIAGGVLIDFGGGLSGKIPGVPLSELVGDIPIFCSGGEKKCADLISVKYGRARAR